MASSMSAASATFRAIGPATARPSKAVGSGPCGTSPGLGRKPTTEQKLAGMRRLPPRSLPLASHTSPVASATAEPPEEPPQLIAVFHGLSVRPNTSLKVLAPAANSGAFERASLQIRPPRHVIGEDRRAVRAAHAGDVHRILDGERQPGEPAAARPRRGRRLRHEAARAVARPLRPADRQRVDGAVDRV